MLVLLSLVSSLVLARQGGHHGHRRPVTGGYSTPQSGAGGLGSLLDGVQVRLWREIESVIVIVPYLEKSFNINLFKDHCHHTVYIVMLVHKICNNWVA